MNEKDIIKYLERVGALITDTLTKKLLSYHTTGKDGTQYTLKNSRIIRDMAHDVKQVGKGEYVLTIKNPNYSIYIDQGRKAGTMPPIKPLKEWMKRHNIHEEALYPIRRKIAVRGIDKRPFLAMAAKRLIAINEIFDKNLPEELEVDLKNLIARLEKSTG